MSSLIKMNIRFVLLVCLLPLFTTAQIFPHHLREDKLLGKVKTITITGDETREIYMYDAKGNQTEKWFFKPAAVLNHRYKAVYNAKGQLLEETKFDKGISPVIKYVYGYDSKGSKIGRSLFSENNTLLEKYIYQYDTAKRMTDSIRVDTYGNQVEKYSFQYNRKGRKTRVRSFWQDSLVFTLDYEYNDAGKIIQEKRYSTGSRQPDYDAVYIYDEKGNKTAEERHFIDHRGDYKRFYTYDSAGRMTSFTSNPGNEKFNEKFIYVFDKKGNKVEESRFDHAGIILTRDVFKYDEKNNQVEMIRFIQPEKPDITIAWKYEYDKAGNWTKKTQLINGTPGETLQREIEYY